MNDYYPGSTTAEGVSLTTTSETTVYTAIGGNMHESLDAVLVSNVTGTDATVTIAWGDNSASATYSLGTGMTVPANGTVWLRPIGLPLAASDTVKATAGTANALHVVALISQSGRVTGYGSQAN